MNPRLLLIPALALLASGCAEENPRHPTSAGSAIGRGGRGAKSDSSKQPATDDITQATAKPAAPPAATPAGN